MSCRVLGGTRGGKEEEEEEEEEEDRRGDAKREDEQSNNHNLKGGWRVIIKHIGRPCDFCCFYNWWIPFL